MTRRKRMSMAIGACAAALRGTGVKVPAVAGFPLGQMTTEAKLFEVRDALAKGAGEVSFAGTVNRAFALRRTAEGVCLLVADKGTALIFR